MNKPDTVQEKIDKEEKLVNLKRLIIKQIDPMDPAPINPYELKNYTYYGYSNGELRSKYWKIFLDYYDKNKFKTEMFLQRRRESYLFYVNQCEEEKENMSEHFNIIENDVRRTYFAPIKQDTEQGENGQICEFLDDISIITKEKHRDIIKRMMKCFALTNPSLGYVQGMCHLLIPIYYVFYNSEDIEETKFCEQDAFFCFNNLMAEVGENFIEDLDHGKTGIAEKMAKVLDIIKEMDEELYEVMKNKGLLDVGFHMKWILIMFVSCLKIPDVLWLWDRLLSDSYRFEMVLYCCSAIIMLLKDVIVKVEFDECMTIFKDLSIIDIKTMFTIADQLRRSHYSKQNSNKK